MKVLGFLIFGMLYILCTPIFPYENSIYIWQRTWKPELHDSIDQMKPLSRQFMVLGGDFNRMGNHYSFSIVPIQWEYLNGVGELTVDIRMRSDLTNNLKNQEFPALANSLKNALDKIVADAKSSGVKIKSLQLDYDCPTAKLTEFAGILREIKKTMPGITLSITALPTWMPSKDFSGLLSSVDYYVLQIHSFELPKGKDKNSYIFPSKKALGYYHQAISFHKPFYLSLPTYGYQVAFSKDTEFIGLRAENGVQFLGEELQLKQMYTDPEEIVNFLKSIDGTQPNYFKGICWFRLPIPSDHYNWDLKTLQRVIKKQLPQSKLTLEINSTSTGVKEIYLKNTGEMNCFEKVAFDLFWSGGKPVYDILGNFEFTELPKSNGLHITGIPPRVSQKKMVAWFRSSDKNSLTISHSEVTIHEKY